jgi:DNA-binding NarL/FixJ family response regulator
MADTDPLIRRARTQIQSHEAQIIALQRFIASAEKLLHETPRENMMAEIDIIALRHGTTRGAIMRLHNRCPKALAGRREAAHFLSAQGKSDSEIARIFNRDVSTIRHILGKVNRNGKPETRITDHGTNDNSAGASDQARTCNAT